MLKTRLKKKAAKKAEQELLSILPVEPRTLTRVGRLLEPKNIKRLLLAALGGSLLASVLSSLSRARMIRASVARELKKQLAPINKKLDNLEKQNEELKKENEELLRRTKE